MNYSDIKLEWFGGNIDALEMCKALKVLLHTWDDIIDKDKPVSDELINNAFLICLVHLQINPFYIRIQPAIIPMWITIVSSYETANKFEKDKDPKGLEISHMLRYAAGEIVAYAIYVCVGAERAREILPDFWKAFASESYEDYRQEHLGDKNDSIN